MKVITTVSDNLDVYRVGTAYKVVENNYAHRPGHGDLIDRGLMLILELQKLGFTVVKQ